MEYHVYKLFFPNGVHFGQTNLESASMTFQADRLFSALCIEALTMGEDVLQKLVSLAEAGRILFSDAFPYQGEECFLPKPLLRIEGAASDEDAKERKKFKKLEYLPMRLFSRYLDGKCTIGELTAQPFGDCAMKTSVYLQPGEEAEPYRIGVFSFREDCGLYFLVGYEKKEDLQFLEELLEMLSLSGIGGRRSSGMGRFEHHYGRLPKEILACLQGDHGLYMSLSVALPQDVEMEKSLEGARYLLTKRSGFVASGDYAEEFRRKRDTYAFSAGSCFYHKFRGQIRDVSNHGRHPVYRYLKPIFMGIEK